MEVAISGRKVTMRMKSVILLLMPLFCFVSLAQQAATDSHSHSIEKQSSVSVEKDTFPKPISIILPPQLFIPSARMGGVQPWIYAPMTRPIVFYVSSVGFNGSESFGEYYQPHPEKFFSNLLGRNVIDLPQLYMTRQMMVGNTLKLDKKGRVFFMSGILYGSQMGVMGNNWGMGTREGLLIRTKGTLSVVLWNQNFQSVSVYTPVVYPRSDGNGAAIIMPATPEVTFFGVQASFISGEFLIDIGVSYSPLPFQKRKHSEFRYR